MPSSSGLTVDLVTSQLWLHVKVLQPLDREAPFQEVSHHLLGMLVRMGRNIVEMACLIKIKVLYGWTCSITGSLFGFDLVYADPMCLI